MNSGNRSKRVSLNRRGGIAGFFWGNLSKSRRLTGIAFAMLLLASAVAAVLYINFGDSLAAVKAEVTSGQGDRMKKSGEFVENNISQEAIVKRASETLSFKAELNRCKRFI